MEKKKILKDHDKIGKRFIPPLMRVGNFQETSYVEVIIPEIIWLAILNNRYGLEKGTECALTLVKIASDVKATSLNFAFIGSYEELSQAEIQKVIVELEKTTMLPLLRGALLDFLSIYPKCPLAFLLTGPIKSKAETVWMKELLIDLYDKRGRTATFMMANVIYFLGILGRLHLVGENSSLAKLPELKDYPETELSRMIASAVRAAMHALMQGPFYNRGAKWKGYFWERGIELEPCYI